MFGKMRKTIIFVDDVKFSLLTTKDRLKKYYDIYPAQTAFEMFDLLQYTMADLILLDINMPGTDGFDILKQLKEDDKYSHIPVVFLSGQNDKKTVTTGQALGAAAHVSKPYSDDDLVNVIDSVLSGKGGVNLFPKNFD